MSTTVLECAQCARHATRSVRVNVTTASSALVGACLEHVARIEREAESGRVTWIRNDYPGGNWHPGGNLGEHGRPEWRQVTELGNGARARVRLMSFLGRTGHARVCFEPLEGAGPLREAAPTTAWKAHAVAILGDLYAGTPFTVARAETIRETGAVLVQAWEDWRTAAAGTVDEPPAPAGEEDGDGLSWERDLDAGSRQVDDPENCGTLRTAPNDATSVLVELAAATLADVVPIASESPRVIAPALTLEEPLRLYGAKDIAEVLGLAGERGSMTVTMLAKDPTTPRPFAVTRGNGRGDRKFYTAAQLEEWRRWFAGRGTPGA